MTCRFIVPPYILDQISRRGDEEERARAIETLAPTERMRGRRDVSGMACPTIPVGEERRSVYDEKGSQVLPGKLVRGEADELLPDLTVDEAYDSAAATYDFYEKKLFCRNPIDDKEMRLDSSVHYARKFDNAF